ncbi:MAG TPA: GxGYxYP family putative glycoside hydrolase [Candidatus Hydrogenedentes bacterium]|nr:GxGYxYP family putative glycoside hydrolase [Candidatus Hydrogenedentota bacterium]HOH49469.1 GxGYxYP family putative glycoside hydrolase [Candidatus Hydrogenedentota bacterium]
MKNALLAFSLVLAAHAPCRAEEPPVYWPDFPRAAKLAVTADAAGLPKLFPEDPGGVFGAMVFTLQSLSGLMALEVRERGGDTYLWVDEPGNTSWARWRDETPRLAGMARADVSDPWALVREQADRGVVKGYILYRADASERGMYEAPPGKGAYNASVNVATSLAAELGALIVDGRAEAKFKELGLPCLLDARDLDEAWLLRERAEACSRAWIHLLDPKAPHMRDHAVASRSLVVFGVNETTEAALRRLAPNAPVFGWNGGDEYHATSQLSRTAHFNTASNWAFNLPALASVTPEAAGGWAALRINRTAAPDPLLLEPDPETHFTAFVMSDGDNVQWSLGNFFDHRDYWQSPARGKFPMGWTVPVFDLSQTAVPALAHLNRTALPNDYVLSFGAGYYYPDEYGADTPDRAAAVEARAAQFAERGNRLGVRVLILLSNDWDCDAAMAMYAAIARRMPRLAGFLAIQYYPYNAGLGEVRWVENAAGDPVPVVSARYGIWAGLSRVENNGPPAKVARDINTAAASFHEEATARFDWTVVHAWSEFQPARDPDDLLSEEITKKRPAPPGAARRGLEPVQWCVEGLGPGVFVVSPEEMLWRLRLAAKPAETLRALARELADDESLPEDRRAAARAFLDGLAARPLGTPENQSAALAELRRIRSPQDAPQQKEPTP